MFDKKTWEDRVSQYPNRRLLTHLSDSSTEYVNVSRAEGTITEPGDPFSAETMNDLENRIDSECVLLESDMAYRQTTNFSNNSILKGNFILWNGKFYKAIRDIAHGDALVVGTNIQETKIGVELKLLDSNTNSVILQLQSLEQSTNNAVNSLSADMRTTQAVLQNVADTRPKAKVLDFTNFVMSNGYAEVTINCSDVFSNGAKAINATAIVSGQSAIILGGGIINPGKNAVKFGVKNLSDTSFTGSLARVTVILWGD